MPIFRSKKTDGKYAHEQRQNPKNLCVFCEIVQQGNKILAETDQFYIVQSKFPYEYWDENSVVDHIMCIPKKHVDAIGKLSAKEKSELLDWITKFESQGYSVYARAPQNINKSVAHQHTHLIKTGSKKLEKLIIYSKNYNIRFIR